MEDAEQGCEEVWSPVQFSRPAIYEQGGLRCKKYFMQSSGRSLKSMAIKQTFQDLSNQQSKNFPLVVGPLTWVPGGEDLLCAAMQGHPSRAE